MFTTTLKLSLAAALLTAATPALAGETRQGNNVHGYGQADILGGIIFKAQVRERFPYKGDFGVHMARGISNIGFVADIAATAAENAALKIRKGRRG